MCGSEHDKPCPATMTPPWSNDIAQHGNDGTLDAGTHSGSTELSIFSIDFTQTRRLERIRFYNRIDCCISRANGAEIRVGSNATWSSNAQCATLNSDFDQTLTCKLTGQYILIILRGEYLNFAEFEAFGTYFEYLGNSIAPVFSSATTSCRCNAGYTGTDGDMCLECSAGTYKSVPGPALCTPCLSNSTSVAGSILHTSCQCNAGYTGANGDMCSECLVDTYKSELGPALCTSCPSNSVSAAASIIKTACQCNAGYTGKNIDACSECLAGTYKSELGGARIYNHVVLEIYNKTLPR